MSPGTPLSSRNERSISTIVLASASPRRRELLMRLGLSFSVAPVDMDEGAVLQSMSAGPGPARLLARAKSRLAKAPPAATVIAADTLVILDDVVLGKPEDAAAARAMLRALRDRTHQVITGVAVRPGGSSDTHVGHATSTVMMRPYSDEEIAAYVASGDPLDKAGGYAIQHPGFHPVARLEGCYWNVVGLPLCELSRLLADAGLPDLIPSSAQGRDRCSLCSPDGPCPAPAT